LQKKERLAHYEKCANFPVRCEAKGCSWTGVRQEWSDHGAACPKIHVNCSIETCSFLGMREALSNHMMHDALHHVSLLQTLVIQLRREADSTRRRSESKSTASGSAAGDPASSTVSAAAGSKRKRRHTTGTAASAVVVDDDDDEDDDWTEDQADHSDEDEDVPCTTFPECPFDGTYKKSKPYGKRCLKCNTTRKYGRPTKH
jgi:hypothetical protein